MFTLAQLVCCLLVPGFLALALGAFRRDLERPADLGGGILLVSALIGHLATALTAGDALWPPRDGWHWAIYAGALLAIGALVLPLGAFQGVRGRVSSLLLHGALAGLGAFLLLRPLAGLGGTTIAVWSIGLAMVTMLTAWITQHALTGTSRAGWLALAAAAAGTAAGIVAGGSKDLGLFAGTLAAAATGLAIRGGSPLGAAAGVIPMAWFVLVGVQYASLHPASAALLLLAPPALILAKIPVVSQHPRLAFVVRLGAPLVVAGLGIALGLALAPHEDGPSY